MCRVPFERSTFCAIVVPPIPRSDRLLHIGDGQCVLRLLGPIHLELSVEPLQHPIGECRSQLRNRREDLVDVRSDFDAVERSPLNVESQIRASRAAIRRAAR